MANIVESFSYVWYEHQNLYTQFIGMKVCCGKSIERANVRAVDVEKALSRKWLGQGERDRHGQHLQVAALYPSCILSLAPYMPAKLQHSLLF